MFGADLAAFGDLRECRHVYPISFLRSIEEGWWCESAY